MDVPIGLGEVVLILGWFALGPLFVAFGIGERLETEWFSYFTLANWISAIILAIGVREDIGLWRAVPLAVFVADCVTYVILYREKRQ